MQDNEPTTALPSSDRSGTGERPTDLHASFADLPRTVRQMMERLGVKPPKELRSTGAFRQFLEQNLDPTALKEVSEPQADPLVVMGVVQDHLSSRSAEALAVHLYSKELLRLITIAAARQIAAARSRREPDRQKQLLLTVRRYASRRTAQ